MRVRVTGLVLVEIDAIAVLTEADPQVVATLGHTWIGQRV
jgi:hypothetical protein